VPPQPNAQHVQNMVTAALEATADQPETVKAAAAGGAAAAATSAIGAPSSTTTNILWTILVTVLGLVTLGSAISMIIYALENKASPPDILTTVFTTTLSGLIGLFVKQPGS
jgi:uncharacterized membrane protein HdeD (DUF308 family)